MSPGPLHAGCPPEPAFAAAHTGGGTLPATHRQPRAADTLMGHAAAAGFPPRTRRQPSLLGVRPGPHAAFPCPQPALLCSGRKGKLHLVPAPGLAEGGPSSSSRRPFWHLLLRPPASHRLAGTARLCPRTLSPVAFTKFLTASHLFPVEPHTPSCGFQRPQRFPSLLGHGAVLEVRPQGAAAFAFRYFLSEISRRPVHWQRTLGRAAAQLPAPAALSCRPRGRARLSPLLGVATRGALGTLPACHQGGPAEFPLGSQNLYSPLSSPFSKQTYFLMEHHTFAADGHLWVPCWPPQATLPKPWPPPHSGHLAFWPAHSPADLGLRVRATGAFSS